MEGCLLSQAWGQAEACRGRLRKSYKALFWKIHITLEKIIKSTLLENRYDFPVPFLYHLLWLVFVNHHSFLSDFSKYDILSFLLCLFDKWSVMALSSLANIYVWFGRFKYLRSAIYVLTNIYVWLGGLKCPRNAI